MDKTTVFSKRKVIIYAIFISLLIFVGTIALSSQWKEIDTVKPTEEFKIIKEIPEEQVRFISYMPLLYLDGYHYSQASQLEYSLHSFMHNEDFEALKEDKLGEVTLDLKGKDYVGVPPDFSSTYDVGTQIYTIKNVKKERAVIVVNDAGYKQVFYRQGNRLPGEDGPINLNVREIFQMITNSRKVSAVELREHSSFAWMHTSTNSKLISIINKEIPKLQLLSSSEIDGYPFGMYSHYIPINLMFQDSAALSLFVFPEARIAYVFGGYIKISSDLALAIQELSDQGAEYQRISDLVPYTEEGISYLYILNHTNGVEVLCEDPKWSFGAWLQMFNYYRVVNIQAETTDKVVMTIIIGESEDSRILINFYENSDKQIVININEHYYKPVKGKIVLKDIEQYFYDYTGYQSR